MPDWMERELVRQLAPVKAPDSLWGRVRDARRTRRVAGAQAGWILWPAVALMMLVASGDLAWQMDRARNSAFHPVESRQYAVLPIDMNANLSCGRSPGFRLNCVGGSVMAAVAHQAAHTGVTAMVSCGQCHVDLRSQL
jgi:hypothetical protein